jgi:hypothetical protein
VGRYEPCTERGRIWVGRGGPFRQRREGAVRDRHSVRNRFRRRRLRRAVSSATGSSSSSVVSSFLFDKVKVQSHVRLELSGDGHRRVDALQHGGVFRTHVVLLLVLLVPGRVEPCVLLMVLLLLLLLLKWRRWVLYLIVEGARGRFCKRVVSVDSTAGACIVEWGAVLRQRMWLVPVVVERPGRHRCVVAVRVIVARLCKRRGGRGLLRLEVKLQWRWRRQWLR